MTTTLWVVLAVLITLALAWAYSTAQRLDKLHVRTDRSRAALEAALNRRAAVIAVLVPEVAPDARSAEEAGLVPGAFDSRIQRERSLNKKIAAVGNIDSSELADANARVMLAVRFYNDAVADTRAIRLRPIVRILRLGGTAPLPEFFEFGEIQ
ncbi:hypothetical protein [Corynebacterium lubricantis]|uniref:hypothetical protein n=1 Tax=Corynebacterium lubricantis TaxID=541095 RepID=UPI00037B0D17|nr:hypothetical protein [Corynebacterium lubricantis]